MKYNNKKIESKWQKKWYSENYFFANLDNEKKKKFYSLDMFPYPSGQGLHVGHPKGYTATDVISRYKRMQGYEVLHPIGWDAFGLPAEQHAIKTGKNPRITTKENISNFRKQLKLLGISYDFSKEINTSSPEYYKTTQFIFSKLHENNLTEQKYESVNWCEELGTVLANEEIVQNSKGEMVSEVGGFPVVKKKMKQWTLKITKYADRLLEGLDDLDWPNSVKTMQREWIGRKEGYNVKLESSDSDFIVFTTDLDLVSKSNLVAVSPENKLLEKISVSKNKEKIEKLKDLSKKLTSIDRKKNKDLYDYFFTGSYSHIKGTKIQLPIYVSLAILPDFGESSEFVLASDDNINFISDSKFLNKDNRKIDIEKLKQKKTIVKKTNYNLKDWLFSRQRYWGEPFPIIYNKNGEIFLDTNFPIELPKIDNYRSNNELPPLSNSKDSWKKIRIKGKEYTRELNTMPQWAGSCWYYIAYLLKDDGELINIESSKAKKRISNWLPVDLYIGGQEHAVLHLLYARFWYLFLKDIGIVSSKEPFYKLINQGMILGPNGEKMSKSKGNVISPNEIIDEFGADALRLYEMFMGPLIDSKSWSNNDLKAMRKWLERVWRLFDEKKLIIKKTNNKEMDSYYSKFIKNATSNLESYKFNLVISDMMVFINHCYKSSSLYSKYLISFLQILSLYAPHISSELYSLFDKEKKLDYLPWPKFNERQIKKESVKLVVQVNGKLKDFIISEKTLSQNEALEIALKLEKIKKIITKKSEVKKVIFVENKILNIVI